MGGWTQVRAATLARKAFAHTAAYDAAIVGWLDGDDLLPPTLHLALERAGEPLRYGENPHQIAALYRPMPGSEAGSKGLGEGRLGGRRVHSEAASRCRT